MEDDTKNQTITTKNFLSISILASALILSGAWVYTARLRTAKTSNEVPAGSSSETSKASVVSSKQTSQISLEEKILPSKGVVLPIKWGDLGVKMISVGVIDKTKLEAIYAARGGLTEAEKKLLEDGNVDKIKITKSNSGLLLNLFWALGLGTKNDILDRGPMMTYSGAGLPAEALAKAGNFASTGGWTLAVGGAMEHYSRHPFIILTPEQQKLVEVVSKNIYRPCCGNSTYFPDCNHGMAMLGLLELMASQGVSEKEMYKTALQVNSYWFPDTYLTIGKYLESKGIALASVDPKEILGADYSSASGYRQIQSLITEPIQRGGGGCGI